jgi:hypothetical protein
MPVGVVGARRFLLPVMVVPVVVGQVVEMGLPVRALLLIPVVVVVVRAGLLQVGMVVVVLSLSGIR